MNIVDREGDLDFEEFMKKPLFAHLSTHNGNFPCESPVWFLWEDGCIWIIGSYKSDTFPKRIKENPSCAIGIVDFDVVEGKVHHVGFRGSAEVVSWDLERGKRKLSKYLGSDESRWDGSRFSLKAEMKNLIFVKFSPETAVIRNQSYKR